MGAVRNQQSCGSCWAFASVGSVEGVWAMAGNDKVDLSEQMLVDCAQGDCDGGWADDGLDTIIRKGGDCTEADYPYHATNGMYLFREVGKWELGFSNHEFIQLWTSGWENQFWFFRFLEEAVSEIS